MLLNKDFVSNTMLACGQVRDQLVSLQKEVSAAQPAVDQLIDDSHNCRRLTEKSRVNVHRGGPHIDLDRVDSDVNRITQRWNNICSQLVDRSVTMISANNGAYDGCSDTGGSRVNPTRLKMASTLCECAILDPVQSPLQSEGLFTVAYLHY